MNDQLHDNKLICFLFQIDNLSKKTRNKKLFSAKAIANAIKINEREKRSPPFGETLPEGIGLSFLWLCFLSFPQSVQSFNAYKPPHKKGPTARKPARKTSQSKPEKPEAIMAAITMFPKVLLHSKGLASSTKAKSVFLNAIISKSNRNL